MSSLQEVPSLESRELELAVRQAELNRREAQLRRREEELGLPAPRPVEALAPPPLSPVADPEAQEREWWSKMLGAPLRPPGVPAA